MSDNELQWYNAVNKHENHTLYSAIQKREAEERRNKESSSNGISRVQPPIAHSPIRQVRRSGRA
jgi:hypothetical protein